jgi:hypothetical protein
MSLTKEELIKALKDDHGIDVEDLEAKAATEPSGEPDETQLSNALVTALTSAGLLKLSNSSDEITDDDIVDAVTELAQSNVALSSRVDLLERVRAEAEVTKKIEGGYILSNPSVQTATEHALETYSPLLPPNPRSMKRFLNMYSVLRAARTAENNTVATAPLAVWTLLRVRWPSLADHLVILLRSV